MMIFGQLKSFPSKVSPFKPNKGRFVPLYFLTSSLFLKLKIFLLIDCISRPHIDEGTNTWITTLYILPPERKDARLILNKSNHITRGLLVVEGTFTMVKRKHSLHG